MLIEKGCRGSIHTNLDVDALRAAEELKTVPQISHEASSASADLETAGQFPTYKCVKTAMYRKRAQKFSKFPPTRQQLEIPPQWRMTKSDRHFLLYNNVYNSILIFCTEENLSILSQYSVWSMDGTFKIVPEWYQQLITIRAFPGVHIQDCYFRFCQLVLRKVTDPGMRTSYIREAETKKKVKMLLPTVSLPLHDVPAAVKLLGRDAVGSVAALFNYFEEEWMTPNRLPLWNRHLSFYELFELLIDQQGLMETLNQQVTSGCVSANDLHIKNKKYGELQLRMIALTAEYDGGTRTMEQSLRAVAYLFFIGFVLHDVVLYRTNGYVQTKQEIHDTVDRAVRDCQTSLWPCKLTSAQPCSLRQKDNEDKKQVRSDHQSKTKPRIYRPRLVWDEEDHRHDGTSTQAMVAQRPQRNRNPPVRCNDYVFN
ncbi:hypothetical protein T07_12394 [Trichinella nelsoni]|uniref:Uncharacterized protein n=1 Tax=Trichinella nelsoni TaxID=6336 RepID=A0A0V0RE44_9BILA|nr:hypothetical protein T07_12394 [Trichinella nelsoni]